MAKSLLKTQNFSNTSQKRVENIQKLLFLFELSLKPITEFEIEFLLLYSRPIFALTHTRFNPLSRLKVGPLDPLLVP